MVNKKFVVKISLLLGVAAFLFLSHPVFAAGDGLAVGTTLPEITLSAPNSDADKEYLGLASEEAFTL